MSDEAFTFTDQPRSGNPSRGRWDIEVRDLGGLRTVNFVRIRYASLLCNLAGGTLERYSDFIMTQGLLVLIADAA